jgi:hypothetical protein
MSGVKMMKRTRGIEQFEFVSIEDAIKLIEQHRAERREKRQARLKKEEEDAEQAAQAENKDGTATEDGKGKTKRVDRLSKKMSSRSRAGYAGSERSTEDWVRSTEELRSTSGSEPSYSPRVRQLEDIARPSSRSSLSRRISQQSPQNETSPESNQLDFESKEAQSPEKSDNGSHEADHAEELSSALYSVPGDAVNPYNIPKTRQTNVLITIAGWITYSEDDHSLPFSILHPNVHGDQYTLIWETEALKDLGSALRILVSEVASFVVQQGIQGKTLIISLCSL